MAINSMAPERDQQGLARVFEFVAVTLLLILPTPLYVARVHNPLAVVLHIGMVIPLYGARKAPEVVFATITGAALVEWIAYQPTPSGVALLIALFGVASLRPLRHALVAAGVVELGVLILVLSHTTLNGGVNEGPGPVRAHLFDFVFLTGLTTAATVLGTNIQTRRAYLREVEERAAQLEAERDQQAQLAVAGERARVAREMHDIVAHNLAVMVALTDGAALTMNSDPDRAAMALREASNAGRMALTDMRRVLGILRDPDATTEAPRESMPHLMALDQLIETVRHTGLDVRYRTQGRIQSLPEALQLSIYRIVQEALTNVMKHARGARAVTVEVAVNESDVFITVHDDGSSPVAPPGIGHGLVGMRERAALHDGTVQAGPTPTGWRSEASLKIQHLDTESEPS